MVASSISGGVFNFGLTTGQPIVLYPYLEQVLLDQLWLQNSQHGLA